MILKKRQSVIANRKHEELDEKEAERDKEIESERES